MSVLSKKQLKNLPTIEQLKRDLSINHFDWFVREYWEVISEEALVWSPHMTILCDELQIMAERVFARLPKLYDLIINIPPGTTKSTIVTIMFPIWCWIADSDPKARKKEKRYNLPTSSLKFISGSYNSDLSLEHALKSRDILRSDKFQENFPYVVLRSDKDAKSHYENMDGGSRFSTSVGGVATGFHGHFLLVDDPLNPKQALATTRTEIKAANDWMDRTLSSRKVDKAITPTILIMQRLCQGDPTDNMLDKVGKDKKVRHICLPDKLPNEVKPAKYKKMYEENGGYLDPVRLSQKVLSEAKKDLRSVAYSGQYEQRPAPEGGAMFKVDKFNTIETMVSDQQIVATVRYWDKAGTKDGGKRTAGVKMHRLRNGMALIENVVKGQWEYAGREARIKLCTQMDGNSCTVYTEQEPGSGGKESAERTVKMVVQEGAPAYMDKVTGSKEARAEPFSAAIEAGNVVLLKSEWTDGFIQELEMAPGGLFKDQWDAAGGAYNKLFGKSDQAGTWGRKSA